MYIYLYIYIYMYISGFDSRWSRHPTMRLHITMFGKYTYLWHISGSYNADSTLQAKVFLASVWACTLAACCLHILCSQVINKLVMTSWRKTQWPLIWRHASVIPGGSRWVHDRWKCTWLPYGRSWSSNCKDCSLLTQWFLADKRVAHDGMLIQKLHATLRSL